jgi:hypothetical protein
MRGFFFLFLFLKKIEKIITKKKHHTKSADGSREDKPTSNLVIVWVLLNLLQHMLSFNLPIVN